jgi:hypothetical protein
MSDVDGRIMTSTKFFCSIYRSPWFLASSGNESCIRRPKGAVKRQTKIMVGGNVVFNIAYRALGYLRATVNLPTG